MKPRHAALAAALVFSACPDRGATEADLREALREVIAQGQTQALENEVAELTTDLTLGGAIEDIAAHVRDLVAGQIDCSTVTAAGSTVEIDLGGLDDGCEYNGHAFAGKITLNFAYDEFATRVVVDHTYAGLTNGQVTLDGTKTVTWDEQSRRVVHDYQWRSDDREAHATGDRVQTLLDPSAGLQGGVEVDGTRRWGGARGTWELAIDGVEVRWIDPVPQAGSYTVTTPKLKEIVMSFARVDADTIEVRLMSGRRDRLFRVTRSGTFEERVDV